MELSGWDLDKSESSWSTAASDPNIFSPGEELAYISNVDAILDAQEEKSAKEREEVSNMVGPPPVEIVNNHDTVNPRITINQFAKEERIVKKKGSEKPNPVFK